MRWEDVVEELWEVEVGRAEGIGDEMGREGGGGVEVADVDIGRAVSVWAARVARGSLACADPVADRGGGEGEDPWRGWCWWCGAWAWAWCCRCRSGDSAVDE